MTFLLRIFLLFTGLVGSYIGSLSFKENSGVDIAIGALGLLVAIICFFFLAKGLWRILGCLTTFVIVALVVGVIFYFLAGSDLLSGLMGKTPASPAAEQAYAPPPQPAPAAQGGTPEMVEMITPMLQAMGGAQAPAPQPQPAAPQPQQRPVITGRVESIASGDQFRIGNTWVRLFGIDAPEIQQTCTDPHGRAYNCGYTVARKLKELLGNDEVNCSIVSANGQGNVVATCSIGEFDLGAAMVESGWAVALRNVTPVYIPYEDNARQKQLGLWAGKFYMPWEWIAQQQQMQAEKSTVKVPKIKNPNTPKKSSIFDHF